MLVLLHDASTAMASSASDNMRMCFIAVLFMCVVRYKVIFFSRICNADGPFNCVVRVTVIAKSDNGSNFAGSNV